MELQEKIQEVATPEQRLSAILPNAQPKVLEADMQTQEPSPQPTQEAVQEAVQPQAPQVTPQGTATVQTQEPELFWEPTEQRRPQEVKTQEPVLFTEPTKTPQKPLPTPRVQEIETERQEMDLKAQKDNVVSSEKQSKINEFTWLVQWGADTTTLADYARNNPTLGKDFNAILKTHFKTKENTDFFAKYSAMSPKNVAEAVKMGKVHLYDEKYNLLPPQQRAEVERLVQMKDTLTAWEKTDFNSPEFQMNMDFDTLMTKMFAPNTAQKIEEMRNDNRLVPLTQQLNRKQAEIEALDVSMIGMQERIEREQAGRLPNSTIRKMIRDEQQALQLDKIAMLSEYRIIQGDIASVQADIDRDIRMLEYEDAQEKQKYAMLYDEYKTRRGEMLARTTRAEDRDFQREMTAEQRQFQVAMAEFEAMQKELAEKRELWYKKELEEFNMKLAEESLAWGDYIDDGNGNLVYVKDGKQINVLTGLWQKIGQEITNDWIWEDFYDEETWVITTFQRNKRTGEQKIEIFTENGQKASDYVNQLWGKITSYGGKHDNYQWLDIDANVWDPIPAPFSWVIEEAMFRPWYGNTIVIRDEATGNKIRYSHLDDSLVFNAGTRFEAWAIIGKAWNTWNVLKLDGTKPTKEELAQGFGSHLDIVSITPDGRTRTSRETEEFLRGLWKETDREITMQDIDYFNSMTPSEKTKQQSNPKFQEFIIKRQEIMDDPNADVYDVIKFSSWGKELTASQVESISKYTATLNSLWEIQETINNSGWFFGDSTWPIKGILRSADPFDVQAQQLKAQITSLIPNLARWVYGEVWVLTEADVALYRQTVPSLTSTDDVNNAVLGMTLRLVRNGMKENLQDLARSGVDTSLFRGKIERIDQQVNAIESKIKQKAWGTTKNTTIWDKQVDFNKYLDNTVDPLDALFQ